MDLKVRTLTYGQGDQTWLASAHGLQELDTGELDLSTFDFVTNFPNNYLPSGVCLGRITATNKLGLYGGNTNDVQTIQVDATGGTFTITYEGDATAAIAFNAAASAVRDALALLPGIEEEDVVVTGGPGNAGHTTPYVVTFSGPNVAGHPVGTLTTGVGSLTGGAGTAAVVHTATGAPGATNGLATPVGLLAFDVPYPIIQPPTLAIAAFLWHGEVASANLPAHSGFDADFAAGLPLIKFL